MSPSVDIDAPISRKIFAGILAAAAGLFIAAAFFGPDVATCSYGWTLVEALSAAIVLVLVHTAVRIRATSVLLVPALLSPDETGILREAFSRWRVASVKTCLETMGLFEGQTRFVHLSALLLGPPATCLVLAIGLAWCVPECATACAVLGALSGAALLMAMPNTAAVRLTALGRGTLAAVRLASDKSQLVTAGQQGAIWREDVP